MQLIIHTPWGPSQYIETIVPGIYRVYTAGHGGIVLDEAWQARVPAGIENWNRSMRFWEEDCDWAVPYLLFPDAFATWGLVLRLGATEVERVARETLKGYRPSWLQLIDTEKNQ